MPLLQEHILSTAQSTSTLPRLQALRQFAWHRSLWATSMKNQPFGKTRHSRPSPPSGSSTPTLMLSGSLTRAATDSQPLYSPRIYARGSSWLSRSSLGESPATFWVGLTQGMTRILTACYRAVHINSMTVHDEVVLPFGGVKNSGWGRFNERQGIEEFLVTKTVTWKD